MSSISAIGTNHTKILTGLKGEKLHNKLAESKAKKWTNMVQVLQHIADMTEVTPFHLLKLTIQTHNNCYSNQHYRCSKLTTKETQQPSLSLERLKCWHHQGDHLKKDCPTVYHQSKSLQSKPRINKEKQQSFQKKVSEQKGTGEWDYHSIWGWELQWPIKSILCRVWEAYVWGCRWYVRLMTWSPCRHSQYQWSFHRRFSYPV